MASTRASRNWPRRRARRPVRSVSDAMLKQQIPPRMAQNRQDLWRNATQGPIALLGQPTHDVDPPVIAGAWSQPEASSYARPWGHDGTSDIGKWNSPMERRRPLSA